MPEPTPRNPRGAGRKPLPPGMRKVMYTTKQPAEVVDYLKSLDNAAVAIETMIRRTKGFREWQKRGAGR